jgi:hypothetical protein
MIFSFVYFYMSLRAPKCHTACGTLNLEEQTEEYCPNIEMLYA